MDYRLNDRLFSTTDTNTQALLATAYKGKKRPLCTCTRPFPEMYIAMVGENYVIKRMPNSGADHAPSCPTYQPPEELSGLAQVQGTAFEENPEDGTTLLRLGFPLSIRGKGAAPPPSSSEATEVKTPDRKLTLTSLLHFLWHEADLIKWYPKMEKKRWWGVVQRTLMEAAANKVAKRQAFDSRLYVPEPFNLEHKNEVAARRKSFFRSISQQSKNSTALGVFIAEYKSHEATNIGAKFIFKHMSDCHFFADSEFLKRFERVFEEKLMLASMVTNCHPIVIGTFSMSRTGYPILQDLGLMLTTENWIPFEHMRDVEAINALTEQKRAFAKSMRFNLPKSTPIASMITLDTVPPTALYISAPIDGGPEEAALHQTADEGTYPAWKWIGDGQMPALPAP